MGPWKSPSSDSRAVGTRGRMGGWQALASSGQLLCAPAGETLFALQDRISGRLVTRSWGFLVSQKMTARPVRPSATPLRPDPPPSANHEAGPSILPVYGAPGQGRELPCHFCPPRRATSDDMICDGSASPHFLRSTDGPTAGLSALLFRPPSPSFPLSPCPPDNRRRGSKIPARSTRKGRNIISIPFW